MERELTDEQVSQLCMYMRVIDFMGKNQKILDENVEMKKQYENLRLTVSQIIDNISEEERDAVLEIHKIQLEEIAKQEAKKQRRKNKQQK
jgi:hypothetical protein